MAIVQHALLSAYLLTQPHMLLTRHQMMQYIVAFGPSHTLQGLPPPAVLLPEPRWTGSQLMSVFFPNDFRYTRNWPSAASTGPPPSLVSSAGWQRVALRKALLTLKTRTDADKKSFLEAQHKEYPLVWSKWSDLKTSIATHWTDVLSPDMLAWLDSRVPTWSRMAREAGQAGSGKSASPVLYVGNTQVELAYQYANSSRCM